MTEILFEFPSEYQLLNESFSFMILLTYNNVRTQKEVVLFLAFYNVIKFAKIKHF